MFAGSTGTDNRTALSVCVIGRNQLRTLRRCSESLKVLHQAIATLETIYVDSASTDDSVAHARTCFDVVIALAPSPHLNASAGRWAGSHAARGDWILFLDGDMELCAEFVPVVEDYLAGRRPGDGVSGPTINVYPDGASQPIHFPGNADSRPCRMFGGAVLISSEALRKAGGWNPRLYSNEEMELYGRLLAVGRRLYWTAVPLARHHTARLSKWQMVRGSFWPYGSILGKKFFGAGQVIVAGIRGRTLTSFLRARAGLFVFLGCGLAAVGAAAMRSPTVAGLLGVLAIGSAVRDGGIKGPVVFASWVPQILFGIWRYPAAFEPQLSSIWRRPGAGGADSRDARTGVQR